MSCSCLNATPRNKLLPGTRLASINDTLVSADGNCTMGFFCFDQRCYVGIWYTADSSKRKIWVANRNTPATSVAELELQNDGNLVISELNGDVKWSSETSGRNVSAATLSGKCNLLLTMGNGSETAWESYEHPTDTWLSGMKLYLNSTTTSWKSTRDPAEGLFRSRMHPQLYATGSWNDSVEYWNSGPWDGKIFANFAEMAYDRYTNFKLYNNTDRPYFIWAENFDLKAHIGMDSDGVLRVRILTSSSWFTAFNIPKTTCDVYRACGPSGICDPKSSLACRCPSGFSPADSVAWDSSDYSLGCVSISKSSFPILALSLGSVVILVVILVVIIISLALLMQRKKDKYVFGELRMFSYPEIVTATQNFKQSLGSGGFGTVYLGKLSQGYMVAVKILSKARAGLEKQFKAEVETLSIIQHVNLVSLLGFCARGSHRMLVYEYLHNGSLDTFLFHKNLDPTKWLDWTARFDIALGTAKALAYLHEECTSCIVHCDLKPANILITSDLKPKVADFGLARIIGRDFSRVLTSMRGTRGYIAPEWINGLPITSKVDVYSYGMTLFEIVSGRKNLDLECGPEKVYFPHWACKQMEEKKVMMLVDKLMDLGNDEMEQVERVVKIAIWCVQDEEQDRPTMSKVVEMLNGSIIVPQPPTPNSFSDL